MKIHHGGGDGDDWQETRSLAFFDWIAGRPDLLSAVYTRDRAREFMRARLRAAFLAGFDRGARAVDDETRRAIREGAAT